jgi:predicted metal-dependent hydrolase
VAKENAMLHVQPPVVPRKGLDFKLDGSVPRHWFGGDPFKTRLFDATSTMFPPGERFFMASVRRYAKTIQDPALKLAVEAFLVQEGQHSKLHDALNRVIGAYGIDTAAMDAASERVLSGILRRAPRSWTIAQTSAAEHLTALLAELQLSDARFMDGADPRVRALYTWHAVEEIEHKAVAFDVMQQGGEVPYAMRCAALVLVTLFFQARTFARLESMLRSDGFTPRERLQIWRGGLRWLWTDQGLYDTVLRGWVRYFRRDFHPWNDGMPEAMGRWLDAYAKHGDPLLAADATRVRRAASRTKPRGKLRLATS